MASPSPFVAGEPGYRDAFTATPKYVFTSYEQGYLPGGKWIDGAKSRDVSNTAKTDRLQAGLLMGKVTATGYYANSFFGQNTVAYNGSTSLTIGTAEATELVRRVGSTGTLTLTGPPAASGTVRSLSLAYSAVNTSTGVVTVTAANVNEVQTVNLVTAGTAGNVRLVVQKVDGTYALTPNIAWSATDATILSNANTALDTATGVVGGIVATAIAATDTDLGFVLTYSGTGYAGNTWALAQVDTMFTSNTGANVVRTTTGVAGAFAAGSLVGQADGSQTPLTFIPGPYPKNVTDNLGNIAKVEFPHFPVAGQIDETRLIGYDAMDASLKLWVKAAISTYLGGKFIFKGTF